MLLNEKNKKNVLVQLFFPKNKCMFGTFIKMNKEL